MKVLRSTGAMQQQALRFLRCGLRVGFVPTMGALHAGHISLVKKARQENDRVVVSIFVNPSQFAPGEDYKKYPRTITEDASLLRKAGTDILFYPQAADIYPEGFRTWVDVQGLSHVLCGAHRLGHFKGVCTVVGKLLNLVLPGSIYLGQKDAQQALIIKRMVSDLAFPVKVVVLPIIRDIDGLAMSSRNRYLSDKQRKNALILPESLYMAGKMVRKGIKDARLIKTKVRDMISARHGVKIDYIEIVDTKELMPVPVIKEHTMIAAAIRVGKTRLIDNKLLLP